MFILLTFYESYIGFGDGFDFNFGLDEGDGFGKGHGGVCGDGLLEDRLIEIDYDNIHSEEVILLSLSSSIEAASWRLS